MRGWAAGLLAATLLMLPPAASADTGGVVTAYCLTGTMADGDGVTWGAAAGADWLPLGSLVRVQGYGTVRIEDRGRPGLFGIDIAMPGDCADAMRWGRQWRGLTVERWGWGGTE